MMELYFVTNYDKEVCRLLLKSDSRKEIDNEIQKFLDERKFKSPYWRMFGQEGDILDIDVGSHSEFFEIRWV